MRGYARWLLNKVLRSGFDNIYNIRYKCKHHKKSKQYILKSRRILVSVSILIISITIMPTFAYFTGTAQITSINSSLNDLYIENGNLNFQVSFSEASMKWYSKDDVLLSKAKKNPSSGDYITYGPVLVKQVESSNLTSKIDLLTEYTVLKDNGLANDNLKARVILTVTRCDELGNAIIGNESFQQIKETTDSKGTIVSMTKKKMIADQVFDLQFKKGWTYKIDYKIILQSAKDMQDTLSKFNIDFNVNSIKIKATQENNPKWGIAGTEDNYHDNVVQFDP